MRACETEPQRAFFTVPLTVTTREQVALICRWGGWHGGVALIKVGWSKLYVYNIINFGESVCLSCLRIGRIF